MKPPSSTPGDPLDRLFAEARTHRPDTSRAEYALETRVLARIRDRRENHAAGSLWSLLPWKLAPFFACLTLTAAIWEHAATQNTQDLERLALDPNPQSLSVWAGDDVAL